MNTLDKFDSKLRLPARAPGRIEDRLHLITAHDIGDLRNCLSRGLVPPDFEAKLARLARGELAHRSIAQNCRTIIALLQAADKEGFKGVTGKDCEQLLRVLAYVRKDDDAIPDYRADGFTDDQKEMRKVTQECDALLQNFKAWRLRHQVPAMWPNKQA